MPHLTGLKKQSSKHQLYQSFGTLTKLLPQFLAKLTIQIVHYLETLPNTLVHTLAYYLYNYFFTFAYKVPILTIQQTTITF